MKSIPTNLVHELSIIKQNVKRELKKKGMVPARTTKDGNVQVGNYVIEKDSNDLFLIKDIDGISLYEKINLAQSAIILANNLALGIKTTHDILFYDNYYGHYLFSEQHCKHLYDKSRARKDYDQAEIVFEKLTTSRLKKKYYYNIITSGFDKLMKIV